MANSRESSNTHENLFGHFADDIFGSDANFNVPPNQMPPSDNFTDPGGVGNTEPSRGPSRGHPRGPSRGPSRGHPRGESRGPSRGHPRGDFRGHPRADFRGHPRGESGRPSRGPSRGHPRGDSRGHPGRDFRRDFTGYNRGHSESDPGPGNQEESDPGTRRYDSRPDDAQANDDPANAYRNARFSTANIFKIDYNIPCILKIMEKAKTYSNFKNKQQHKNDKHDNKITCNLNELFIHNLAEINKTHVHFNKLVFYFLTIVENDNNIPSKDLSSYDIAADLNNIINTNEYNKIANLTLIEGKIKTLYNKYKDKSPGYIQDIDNLIMNNTLKLSDPFNKVLSELYIFYTPLYSKKQEQYSLLSILSEIIYKLLLLDYPKQRNNEFMENVNCIRSVIKYILSVHINMTSEDKKKYSKDIHILRNLVSAICVVCLFTYNKYHIKTSKYSKQTDIDSEGKFTGPENDVNRNLLIESIKIIVTKTDLFNHSKFTPELKIEGNNILELIKTDIIKNSGGFVYSNLKDLLVEYQKLEKMANVADLLTAVNILENFKQIKEKIIILLSKNNIELLEKYNLNSPHINAFMSDVYDKQIRELNAKILAINNKQIFELKQEQISLLSRLHDVFYDKSKKITSHVEIDQLIVDINADYLKLKNKSNLATEPSYLNIINLPQYLKHTVTFEFPPNQSSIVTVAQLDDNEILPISLKPKLIEIITGISIKGILIEENETETILIFNPYCGYDTRTIIYNGKLPKTSYICLFSMLNAKTKLLINSIYLLKGKITKNKQSVIFFKNMCDLFDLRYYYVRLSQSIISDLIKCIKILYFANIPYHFNKHTIRSIKTLRIIEKEDAIEIFVNKNVTMIAIQKINSGTIFANMNDFKIAVIHLLILIFKPYSRVVFKYSTNNATIITLGLLYNRKFKK